ncbi:MAG: hypothetical protein Q8N60_01170, partial [Candidatus Diapherotrites archaeon]|nr:hypothetical protein [Candidatus Diapherotrites archaeon]
GRPPRMTPALVARIRARMSAEQIAEYNASIAKTRERKLSGLRSLLRDKRVGNTMLDPETRGVAKKFARLPFGCITDSCAGHFADKPIMRKRVSVEKMKLGQKFFASGSKFELIVDLSPAAMEFRRALGKFNKRFAFRPVLWAGAVIIVRVPIKREKRFGGMQAAEIRRLNLQLINKFESLVGGFAAKYGVEVKL